MNDTIAGNLQQFVYLAEAIKSLADNLEEIKDEVSDIWDDLCTAESYVSDCRGTAEDLANDAGEKDLGEFVDQANEIEGAASECESEISNCSGRLDSLVGELENLIDQIQHPVN
jgi:chromosome segregation ATPase